MSSPDLTGADIAAGDPRITCVGKVLRRTKLDELPQLINVVRGEMSLVGPRPEDPRYVALYTPEQRRVLSVRPGITSMASVKYRHEEVILSQSDLDDVYVNRVMPEKLAIDLAYLDRRTFWRYFARSCNVVPRKERTAFDRSSPQEYNVVILTCGGSNGSLCEHG